ncbi:hypothetical protein OF83DRAFT_538661 [Amylostereum chailletii]|nr:hypothetical protein OF83DRAFT_538661 [Amylostereum chailletii]
MLSPSRPRLSLAISHSLVPSMELFTKLVEFINLLYPHDSDDEGEPSTNTRDSIDVLLPPSYPPSSREPCTDTQGVEFRPLGSMIYSSYPGQKPPHSQKKKQKRPRQHEQKPNRKYDELRRRANDGGDAMRREELHTQASAQIYKDNNEFRPTGEIDLHGLRVKEAIEYTDRAIEGAQARGDHKVYLIVGKGLHSENKVPKIRPAIEKYLKRSVSCIRFEYLPGAELLLRHRCRLVAAPDPNNEGVLVVRLGRGKNKT